MSNVPSINRPSLTPISANKPTNGPVAKAAVTPLRRDGLQVSAAGAAQPLQRFTLDVARLDSQLDRITGTKVSEGNSVELHIDGKEAYPRMLDLIGSAKRTLHMEMYIFKDDEACWDVAQALAERAQSGVKVRLTTDVIGSPTNSRIYDFLRSNGVEVRHHTPLAVNSQITHRKMVIADGAKAMTGGMNIAEEYRSQWHDAMITIQGPSVHEMQRHFLETWKDVGGKPVAANEDVFAPLPAKASGNAQARVITTYPRPDIQRSLFAAIDAARSHVNFETPYFTDDALVDRLVAAAKRGVTVNLVIPAVSDVGLVDKAARYHFQRLTEAGVKIHLYEGRTLHTKAATVDGVWGTIGSCNSDNRSLRLHRELNIAFSDAQTVAALDERLFAQDFKDSRVLKPAEAKQNWMGRLASWATRLINSQL